MHRRSKTTQNVGKVMKRRQGGDVVAHVTPTVHHEAEQGNNYNWKKFC